MSITIPHNVLHAIKTLEQNGFEAYAVGGCVRDSLLGLVPYDWDICTCALPEQTAECFADCRVIPTGVKHGTITVIIEEPIEITTFRIDGDYLDNRRPSDVSFTRNLKDDLCRRDFTVNAMALGTDGTLIDLYGGQRDLAGRLIRCVGDAQKRFDEDALRIMRALRFAATLGFKIEKETADAIHLKKHLLKNIAAERIQKEFSKLILGNCSSVLHDFSDVIKVFLPEIQTDGESINQLALSPADASLRLALLMKSCDTKQAADRLRTLKYDNLTISTVTLMLASSNDTPVTERPQIKRMINRYGAENVAPLLQFHRCLKKISDDEFRFIFDSVDEIISSGECCSLSKLSVNGSDISSLGIFRPNQIGKVLHALLEKVMDGEVANEKEILISLARELNY